MPDPYKRINPYTVPPSDDMWSAIDSFYRHYYDDTDSRILIIGSNPSRSRSAVSGIPYEDPVKEDIGTNPNDTHTTGKKNFLQDVIDELGGKKLFYRKYYMGFFFPFGIERTSPQKRPTNANYYEDRALLEATKPISQKSLEYLLKTGVRDDICFCLGKGKHV